MKRALLIPSLAGFLLQSAFAQSAALPALPPDGFVTLQQIVSDFSTAPDAALQKYNGMRILVYGRVGQVAQSNDAEGDPLTVFMQLPNQTTPDVKAVFTPADVPTTNLSISEDDTQAAVFHRDWDGTLSSEKSFITEGENVGIRGTFDNFVAGDVVLKNSFKLDTGVLMKKLAEHGIPTE